jgi:hypothetical protein
MKATTQLILQLTFTITCVKLQSQTLTCDYNCPRIGEMFSTKTSSPVAHTSGLNQVWNFTQVSSVSTNVSTISYVDPATVPSSTSYSQGNIARLGYQNNAFLQTGTSGIKLMTANNVTVNTQSTILPLPFSYGSTHSETIVTSYMSGSDLIVAISKKSLNGIATGTLMLPTGTYTDVLRITGTQIDSHTNNGSPSGYVMTTTFNYYYSEKISHPLLYSEQRYDNSSTNDYIPFTQFVSEITTGLRKEPKNGISEITIAPNPASNKMRVTTVSNGVGEVLIINPIGEVVFNQHYTAGQVDLDLSELAEGLYTVLISQGENIQSKKLVLSR